MFWKKITNFSKTQILYVSGNHNISVAPYGWKTFKLENEHKRQVGNNQVAKCKRNVQFQIWMNDLPSIFTYGRET